MLTGDDLPAFPKEVAALHFGSLSLAEEPCGSAFEMLMQRDQRDCVISLDPNIRPALIKNRDGYLARLDRMIAMTDLLKMSEDDHNWIAPGKALADSAREWLKGNVKLVVFTRGAEGAVAFGTAGSVTVSAEPVTVVDTVGAGDAVTAAILARLAQRGMLGKDGLAYLGKRDLSDLLGFAMKAAAVTVSRAGADPPHLREIPAAP
jgi:fructokinase